MSLRHCCVLTLKIPFQKNTKGFENLSQGLCRGQDKIHPSPGCSDGAVMFMGTIRSVNGLGGPSSYKPFVKDSQKNTA